MTDASTDSGDPGDSGVSGTPGIPERGKKKRAGRWSPRPRRGSMSIHAHPDDQEFTVGGTLAKWARAGSDHRHASASREARAGSNRFTPPDMTREALGPIRESGAAERLPDPRHRGGMVPGLRGRDARGHHRAPPGSHALDPALPARRRRVRRPDRPLLRLHLPEPPRPPGGRRRRPRRGLPVRRARD